MKKTQQDKNNNSKKKKKNRKKQSKKLTLVNRTFTTGKKQSGKENLASIKLLTLLQRKFQQNLPVFDKATKIGGEDTVYTCYFGSNVMV